MKMVLSPSPKDSPPPPLNNTERVHSDQSQDHPNPEWAFLGGPMSY